MRSGRLTAQVLVLSAMVVAASGCASMAELRQEEAKTNTQTVLAFEETIYNKHQIQEAFAHYVGQTYREHDARFGEGRDSAMRALTRLVEAYAASRVTVQRTIAQGNLVAVQLIWNAQPPPARGIPRVDFYRLEEGRIVEHWAVTQEAMPIAALMRAAVAGSS